MGIYNNFCYKVEDAIVKITTKKENADEVQQKVVNYRKRITHEKAIKKRVSKNG